MHPNSGNYQDLFLLVAAIVVLGYSVQELVTCYLFSEEEIKEMNENKNSNNQ